jgi:hypothetical protein
MKRKVIVLFVLSVVAVCCAILLFVNHRLDKGRIINDIKITDMFDFTLTKAPERLDIDFIHKEIAEVGMYEKSLSDGTCLRIADWDNGRYKLELTPANSYFSLIKFCHPNGVVSAKGYQFHDGGFDKGIWYYYDEPGYLMEEVNYDNMRQFSFEQVLRFCKGNDIQVNKGHSQELFFETIIYYGEETNTWGIYYHDKSIAKFKRIGLDGNTGDIVSTEEVVLEI